MLELAPVQMVPLHGALDRQVQQTLFNISQFDHARFEVWRKGRAGGIPTVANARPPDKLYRVVTDNELEDGVPVLVLGVVIGYQEGSRGVPAQCMVQVLGVDTGAGSYETPIPVPVEALEDVTERARGGKLLAR